MKYLLQLLVSSRVDAGFAAFTCTYTHIQVQYDTIRYVTLYLLALKSWRITSLICRTTPESKKSRPNEEIKKQTTMLAINVSVPNLTVASLEQFRLSQLRNQRERSIGIRGWIKCNHTLYEIPMWLYPTRGCLQPNRKGSPLQRPLDPRGSILTMS